MAKDLANLFPEKRKVIIGYVEGMTPDHRIMISLLKEVYGTGSAVMSQVKDLRAKANCSYPEAIERLFEKL